MKNRVGMLLILAISTQCLPADEKKGAAAALQGNMLHFRIIDTLGKKYTYEFRSSMQRPPVAQGTIVPPHKQATIDLPASEHKVTKYHLSLLTDDQDMSYGVMINVPKSNQNIKIQIIPNEHSVLKFSTKIDFEK